MILEPDECEYWLSMFEFEKDVRKPPDNLRRGQFKAGWRDSVFERCPPYSPKAMKKLTWRNLGYRWAGTDLGSADADVEGTYESFARHFQQ